MGKLVVFDLDGTLNRTDLYAVEAYQCTLKDMGLGPVPAEKIIERFGAPFEEDFHHFFPGESEEKRQSFEKILGKYWDKLLEEKGRVFPGVEEMLQKLRCDGYETAICSNAVMDDIMKVLRAIGLDGKLDYIQSMLPEGGKDAALAHLLRSRKPKWACMIGDRFYDRDAAAKNNISFIGCAYGYGPEEIKDADAVVKCPLEIPAVLEYLLKTEAI